MDEDITKTLAGNAQLPGATISFRYQSFCPCPSCLNSQVKSAGETGSSSLLPPTWTQLPAGSITDMAIFFQSFQDVRFCVRASFTKKDESLVRPAHQHFPAKLTLTQLDKKSA